MIDCGFQYYLFEKVELLAIVQAVIWLYRVHLCIVSGQPLFNLLVVFSKVFLYCIIKILGGRKRFRRGKAPLCHPLKMPMLTAHYQNQTLRLI